MVRTPIAGGNPGRVSLTGSLNINVLLGFVFGVIFLTTMLVFSVFFPNPTIWQTRVWITCLALSAAGAGAVIPGFLEVRYKNTIRATGSIALFVIVYLLQPTLETKVPSFPEPTVDPAPIAENFLQALDEGRVLDAYNALDSDAKIIAVPDFTTFETLYRNSRASFGAGQSRSLIASNGAVNPPGYSPGRYRTLTFRTRFVSGCRGEQVALRATQDLSWHVWTYEISGAPLPCE
jgi:hypothetical protein